MIPRDYPRIGAATEPSKHTKCCCCEAKSMHRVVVDYSYVHGDAESYDVCHTHLELAQTDIRSFLQRVRIREDG